MKKNFVLLIYIVIHFSCIEIEKNENANSSNFLQMSDTGYTKIQTNNYLKLNFKVLSENGEDVQFINNEYLPEFPGGYDSLANFIKSTFQFPETTLNLNIDGLVKTSFVVNSTGKVVDETIENGLQHELDSATIRMLRMIPDWNTQELPNGHKYNYKYLLPLRFKLKED